MSAVEPAAGTRSPVADIELLFQEYSSAVYRYCFARLGSREEAEDAVQVTFLNALRSLRRGTQPGEPRAWLFTIAANVSATVLRSRMRGAKVEVRAPEDFERMPSDGASEHELIDLDAALDALPTRQRQALLLRDWRGLSYAEIATELDASEPAVETLLFRARRAVAVSLARPARRLREVPLRPTLSAFLPWPSALSGLKSSLANGVTAKALAIAVGATAPLVAFGVVERALTTRATPQARNAPPEGANVGFDRWQQRVSSPLPGLSKVARRPAAPTHTPRTLETVVPGDPTTWKSLGARAGAGGTAPVSEPAPSTSSPSTSSDPPADETAGGLVVICHATGSKKHPSVTISVAAPAVDVHLAHGDQIGPCAS
jgi:RNA polymerase sigma factor (sigma-70 family)